MNPKFIEMLKAMADPRVDSLADTLENTKPEVSIRLNPTKHPLHPSQAPVEWWPEYGQYLAERPKFTFDPALHQGAYYVQDASSMIMAPIAQQLAASLRASAPLLWLDACAAPGGKTTAAIDALPEGSLVVANEFDFQRAEILKENLAKWGSPNVVVARGDTKRFRKLPDLFDVVAVDAPCSGEGMMRKDPIAREQWSPALVAECAERQREILENLWETLRPGGFLIYSTCTFNTTENEEIVRWLIEEFGAIPVDLQLPFDIDGPIGMETTGTILRFIPGRIRGEGLFLAVLQKPGSSPLAWQSLLQGKDAKGKRKKCGPDKNKKSPYAIQLKNWISSSVSEDYAIEEIDSSVVAKPKSWLPVIATLERQLDVIACGVELAEVKGKDLIPSQSLALSTILNGEAFPKVAVGRDDALRYLSKETINLPDDTPRGFILLTYNSLPLGFVKNIGNRSNNLYPKEWRIKSKLSLPTT